MANPDAGLAQVLRPGLRLMETAAEAVGIEIGPRAGFATPNRVILDLKTLRLRDYSKGEDGVPILIHAPFAGHSFGSRPQRLTVSRKPSSRKGVAVGTDHTSPKR